MWSELPFLYRFTVLLSGGGSNSPWSEFWSEFPHFMGMGVVPAPSTKEGVFAEISAEKFANICNNKFDGAKKECGNSAETLWNSGDNQEWPRQPKIKERSVHEIFTGAFRNKSSM